MPSRSSKVVYEGEVLITEFDLEDFPRLEAELADFIDLDEGEELHASIDPDGAMTVRKLRRRESR